MGKEKFHIYIAKFYKDRILKEDTPNLNWLIPLQVGSELTNDRVADLQDNVGNNISIKNPNYCELTALYWIWKNVLGEDGYYGLYHYRRWLNIDEKDMDNIIENNVDVILPYPTLHEPDIREHHRRYIKESDWEATLITLKEISPDYFKVYNEIFSQEYFYNYNILVAKAKVLEDYCNWLFPILERVEELSKPKSINRNDRYIGYIAENLLTLYFMYNKNQLNIVHTGRKMII